MLKKLGTDAGHGGHDPGAIGRKLQIEEKDVVLDVVKELNRLAKELYNLEVTTTRSDDTFVELSDRTNKLKKAGVELSVSVHCNSAFITTANYVRTFVYNGMGNKTSGDIAKAITKAICKSTGWTDGGQPVAEANLHMVREIDCPAVLVELGFISNKEQEQYFSDLSNRKKLAAAILKGIANYYGLKVQLKPSKEPDTVKIKIPTKKLAHGSEGTEVKQLQFILVNVFKKNIKIDGEFGDNTEKALKEVQTKAKLKLKDGKYGPETLKLFKDQIK